MTADRYRPDYDAPKQFADKFDPEETIEAEDLSARQAISDLPYWGLAGDFVRAVEPHTEADPAAMLLQFLAAFGSIVGRGPHFNVGAASHHMNIFAVCVGQTAKARKGTSWEWIRRVLAPADPDWAANRIAGGLSSGDGLVHAVRDPLEVEEPVRRQGRVVDYQTVRRDAGVADKRLLVLEPEFARALRAMERRGNTLSALLRLAWDGDSLRILSRQRRDATDPHISLIAHITDAELHRLLHEDAMLNGFANRFLWLHVERSRTLAESGPPPDKLLAPIAARVAETIAFAREVGEMTRDDSAEGSWISGYNDLSKDSPGVAGAVTGRAEAQVLRLSCIYALLDRSALVRPKHLYAAILLWDLCEQSALSIFGAGTGDPVADKILEAVRRREDGFTQSDITNLFGRNVAARRLRLATLYLQRNRLIRSDRRLSGGRPVSIWYPNYSAPDEPARRRS